MTDASVANLTSLSLTNASLFSFAALSELKPTPAGSCRVFPGDAAWPSPEAWAALGLAVGSGGLIKTVPIGASCYKNGPGTYDAARCQELVERWSDSFLHMEDPASSMWPLYQGKTCMPDVNATTADEGKGRNCTLGGFPSYVVDATDVSRIQLAVNFARNANLRLVVRNTGHDFNGRSLGEGALAIWTHKLKDVRFFSNLTEGAYTGPAMKLGAGVQAFELYEAADKYNVTAVGGEGKVSILRSHTELRKRPGH